jgi:predicted Ser/Thr protein kinase
MSDAPVYEGAILAGKYRVEKVLGVGGMGVVVAATHLQLEERVALKFLTADALQSGEAVARFAREARAAVKIKSEHVARVIDVGTLETGAPYMVMEYLDGSDLAAVLRTRGALPVEEAVEYVLQACEALAEAHVLGIVHRDLKPANLFLIRRADGTASIKVLDFGISKFLPGKGSSSDAAMTRTRTVMGSPLYMSPEQMASTRDVDGRTDLWALGVILFELVSGEPPFNADTMPQLCAMILNAPAPSVRRIAPRVPIGLDAVIGHCLERDVADRYANVAQLASALRDYAPARALGSIERIARIVGGAHAMAPGRIPTMSLNTSRAWVDSASGRSPVGGHRSAIWTGVGAAVVVVAGLGWAIWSGTAAPGRAADLVRSAPVAPIPAVEAPAEEPERAMATPTPATSRAASASASPPAPIDPRSTRVEAKSPPFVASSSGAASDVQRARRKVPIVKPAVTPPALVTAAPPALAPATLPPPAHGPPPEVEPQRPSDLFDDRK